MKPHAQTRRRPRRRPRPAINLRRLRNPKPRHDLRRARCGFETRPEVSVENRRRVESLQEWLDGGRSKIRRSDVVPDEAERLILRFDTSPSAIASPVCPSSCAFFESGSVAAFCRRWRRQITQKSYSIPHPAYVAGSRTPPWSSRAQEVARAISDAAKSRRIGCFFRLVDRLRSR
jgi:hypothetical protein